MAMRRWIAVALLALAFGVAAPVPASAEAQRVRLGNFPNVTHAQAVYARATGQLERVAGVPIEWTTLNAGPTAIEAMFADAIDLTFVGPNPAINGYMKSHGHKFAIIAGGASGGAALVVRKDAGIRSAGDFGGKIVATPQLGNTQDVAARSWFAAQGYTLAEKGGNLALLALSNPDQLTMFMKREIHAAWTVEPWVARLEIEGGGELFLDEGTLWPHGRYATTLLIANRTFVAANPNLVRRLLAGLVEITQTINADKPAAGRILNDELEEETGRALLPAVMERSLQRVELTWDPIAASLHASAAAAHELRFIRNEPNLTGIFDLRLLNDALAAKGLPPVTP